MAPPRRSSLALPDRGVTLSLLDFGGSGSPALLCHANGFCAALWEPIAARLRERHRVLAFDARGHGESSAPPPPEPYRWSELADDLLADAGHLATGPSGAAPLHAIGHSMGGAAVLEAAARRPEWFARIALLDPVLRPRSDAQWAQRLQRYGIADRASRRREQFASRDEVRERYAGREPFARWDPRVFELYLREGFADEPGGVRLRCRAAVEAALYRGNDLDPIAAAEKLRVPGLVLFAAQGHFPRAAAEAVAARAAHMRVEDVDAGHLFPMEMPERTAQRLLRTAEED
jgi:pimeloyl-ACP methyl ester carboxylesterase